MTNAAASLAREADIAASRGDRVNARRLLEELVTHPSPAADTWLKLASMRRFDGDLHGALAATHAALALTPLDFTGLLLRASLLEKIGDAEADEAFGRAVAQKPPGPLPGPMGAMLAHAETRFKVFSSRREASLAEATSAAAAALEPDQRQRFARFRSNAVHRTRPYHSEPTHFHYPGLVEREYHPRGRFPWLADLEAATDAIAAEFAAVAQAERAELVPYVQYAEHEPLQQWRALNHSRDWTAIHLLQNGAPIAANARHCPQTLAVLGRIGQPEIARCSPNAMFSLLAPRTSIPPHVGVANTRLVCHLPLIVPPDCWFRVGAETRLWRRDEALVFDDTIEHEAANPSDELRVVLIFGHMASRPCSPRAAGRQVVDGSRKRRSRCAMSMAAASRSGGDDPREIADLASSALDEQREAEVIDVVAAAAEQARSDALLWQWTGLLNRALDRHDRALAAFHRAASLAPRDVRIAHGRARVALEAGLPAIDLFAEALRLRPADNEIRLGLAAALMAEGRADEAISGLDAALRQDPRWIAGHETLGRLRWMMGDRAGFLSSHGRALATDPAQPRLWQAAIIALIHGGEFERASAAIDAARSHVGDQRFLDANEAVISSELGQVTAADALFARLGEAEDATLAVHLVRHLLRSGRVEAALPIIDAWLVRPERRLMWPYASAAWRMGGDPRGLWLDNPETLVSVIDLADRLPPLDRLAALLRSLHRARAQHLDQSVRGGTQTDGALFSRLEPELRIVRAAVSDAVSAHIARLAPQDVDHPTLAPRRDREPRFAGSWSVRLAGGGHHAAHVHPAGWISSALYIALPKAVEEDGHEGWLTLGAPQAELGLPLPPTRFVQPKPGRLVLFPSTMWHGTEPFGAGERLTIAFDVALPL